MSRINIVSVDEGQDAAGVSFPFGSVSSERSIGVSTIEGHIIEKIDRRDLLDRWFAVLSDNELAVVIWFWGNDMSFAEIARLQNTSSQATEQRWRSALAKLIALRNGETVGFNPQQQPQSRNAEQFDDADLGDPALELDGAA